MRKINIFLIILLVVQIGLIAFQYRPGQNDSGPVVKLLPEITAEDVSSFTVEGPENEQVHLIRSENGDWQISGSGAQQYPADQDKTDDMLQRLTSLKSQRLVTRTSASHPRLKVGDRIFAKKISLQTDRNDKSILYLGSPVGGQALHARSHGSDRAYLVTGISAYELGTAPDSWWEKDYVNLGDREIRSVSLDNSKGSFTMVNDNGWHLREDGNATSLSGEKVTRFLNKIDSLKIKDYLAETEAARDLRTPEAVLNIQFVNGEINLRAAHGDGEENAYTVKSSGSPHYVSMGSFTLTPLLEQKAEDFRKR